MGLKKTLSTLSLAAGMVTVGWEASAFTLIEITDLVVNQVDIGFQGSLTTCTDTDCVTIPKFTVECPSAKGRIGPKVNGLVNATNQELANGADEAASVDDLTSVLEGAIVRFDACGPERKVIKQ